MGKRLGMAQAIQKAENKGSQGYAADQFGNGQSEMGADKGTQICRDGGKERIPGGQNRHQDTQQDDGSRSAEQNRRQTPGPGGGVSGGGQGGKEGAQPAEQIAQQQAKAFPEHSGTEPRQRCGTGKSDGMDRQQHQQRQQVPQPEIPV